MSFEAENSSTRAVVYTKDVVLLTGLRPETAQKMLRKVPGNWTFVVVTDRVELDEQIAKTFKTVGAVSEADADMSARGVANPMAVARMLAPGFSGRADRRVS